MLEPPAPFIVGFSSCDNYPDTGGKRDKCGNCGEYAMVVFDYLLLNSPLFPFELARYKNADHEFVIIGRPIGTDLAHPEQWGSCAVIADAWADKVVPARLYWSEMYCPDHYFGLLGKNFKPPEPILIFRYDHAENFRCE